MLTVRKSCRFDAAHVLSGHAGACRSLHGHTYKVVAEVAQPRDTCADMVIDFHDLKAALHTAVVVPLDHAFLYDTGSTSECEIAAVLARQDMKQVGLPFRTTAENLARHIFRELAGLVNLVSICVYETPDSCAEYREDPAR